MDQISIKGNVKVDAKALILGVFGDVSAYKSEIRISPDLIKMVETISNFEYQMTKTFQTVIQYLRGSTRLEFWILVIRICFGFRVSCFEFIENPISKQFSLSQQVISLNDVALNIHTTSDGVATVWTYARIRTYTQTDRMTIPVHVTDSTGKTRTVYSSPDPHAMEVNLHFFGLTL